jgi:hypothetical protein
MFADMLCWLVLSCTDRSRPVQVFWHILTKLAYYRELTLRIDQLAAKGMLDPAALAAAASGGVVSRSGCSGCI